MQETSQHSTYLASHLRPYLTLRPCMPWSRTDWGVALLLLLFSTGLYTATLAPTISTTSFDSAELITKSSILQVAHMPGSPFYVFLGHIFSWLPFGEPATRVNWMSALLGGLAVALLYATGVRYLTGNRLCAAAGALLFAVSITFWSQAVVAELYAPNMAFVAFVVFALLEWGASTGAGRRGAAWLVVAAVAFGLSLGIHLSNVLYLPAFGAFALLGWPVQSLPAATRLHIPSLLRRFHVRAGVLTMVLGLLAVLVPYGWEYITLPLEPRGDGFPQAAAGWPLFYESTLNAFKSLRFGFTLQQVPDRTVLFLHLLERNLTLVGVALLVLGAWRLLFTQVRPFFLLLLMILANTVFYINYNVPDGDVYFIPAYWAAAGLVGVGLYAVTLTVQSALRGAVPRRAARSLAAGLVALVGIGAAAWCVQNNYAANDLSHNVSSRDFYGNELELLPQGAYLYHRGASLGYDLLYYTQFCGVRPDLHVQAGVAAGEPPPGQVAWPPGPVYSSVNNSDAWLPNFIADPDGSNRKWYDPVLTGMFRWEDGSQYGWLNLYRVLPYSQPPDNWMVPISSAASHPSHPLHVDYTSLLTLVGVDADPQATPGRPWHMVRYWYARGDWIPPFVTVFGDHIASESHMPLFGQFREYVKARKIDDLGLYVVRDDVHLIIPSSVAPGRYNVTTAVARPRLMSLLLDPAPPGELLADENVVATVQVVAGQQGPPDPLLTPNNGRCRR